MDLETGKSQTLAKNVLVEPSLAPDAPVVVYHDFKGAIWAHDLTTGERRALTPDGSSPEFRPVHSPDGSMIAFHGGGIGLQVMTRDGTSRRTLAPADAYAPRPSWSPDGGHITFLATSRDGGIKVHTIRADGSERRPVAANANGGPVWSPDGSLIAFRGTDNNVRVVRPDGSGERIVPTPGPVGELMSWSPDSRSLAVTALESTSQSQYSLFIINARTGQRQQVGPVGDASSAGTPVFTPDGEAVVYFGRCGDTGDPTRLCLAGLTTGAVRTLDGYAGPGRPIFVP